MQFFISYLIREQGQDKVVHEKKTEKKLSQVIHVNRLEPNCLLLSLHLESLPLCF